MEGERISVRQLLDLLQRQEYRCALTGRTLNPESCCLDHKVPISLGGHHVMSNVQLVCEEVNIAKGCLPQPEFIRMCMDVVRSCCGVECDAILSGS